MEVLNKYLLFALLRKILSPVYQKTSCPISEYMNYDYITVMSFNPVLILMGLQVWCTLPFLTAYGQIVRIGLL